MHDIQELNDELMVIATMESPIEKEAAIKDLAKRTGIGVQAIKKEIKILENNILERIREAVSTNQFTRDIVLENGDIMELPHPYMLFNNRLVKQLPMNKNDEERRYERIINGLVFISAFTKNQQTYEEGAELSFSLNKDQHYKSVILDWPTLNSASKILSLGTLGIPVNSVNAYKVIEFLDSYVASNRENIPTINVVDSFGLHLIEGEWHFVLGGKIISQKSSKMELVKNSDSTFSVRLKAIHSKGDSALWVEAMQFFKKYDQPLFILGAVLAAPMMKFFNISPFTIHLCGNSSRGKSTAIKVGASFCGDANSDSLMLTWNCSRAAGEARLTDFNGATPIFDDLSQVRSEDIVTSIIYMIGNARGAQRGTVNGGSQKVMSFSGIALSTGEAPIIKTSSLQGMAVRVLEFDEPPFGERFTQDELVLFEEYNKVVLENYGHYYEPYIQTLIEDLNSEDEKCELQSSFNLAVSEMKSAVDSNNFSNRIIPYFAIIKLALFRLSELVPELGLTNQRIEECILGLLETRLKKLDSKSNIDYKALQYVIGRVISHPGGFEGGIYQNDMWGKYLMSSGDRSIEAYAIFQHKLFVLLKDGGFDPDAMTLFFKQNKWIELDSKGGLKTVSFPGKTSMRCFVFRVDLLQRLGIIGKDEESSSYYQHFQVPLNSEGLI